MQIAANGCKWMEKDVNGCKWKGMEMDINRNGYQMDVKGWNRWI